MPEQQLRVHFAETLPFICILACHTDMSFWRAFLALHSGSYLLLRAKFSVTELNLIYSQVDIKNKVNFIIVVSVNDDKNQWEDFRFVSRTDGGHFWAATGNAAILADPTACWYLSTNREYWRANCAGLGNGWWLLLPAISGAETLSGAISPLSAKRTLSVPLSRCIAAKIK